MNENKLRKTIYRFKNGSHMYGLNTPTSDVDYMEVFLPSPEDILGLKVVEVIDQSTKASSNDHRNNEDDIDDNRYNLQRYLQLLLANNPNILETLFVPNSVIEVKDFLLSPILTHPEKIVCKKAYSSFCGYARSQEHKLLEKRARYLELCQAVEYLEKDFAFEITITTSQMSQELADTLNKVLKHYKGAKHNIESFHVGLPMKTIYEKLKIERDTYGWRVKTETFDTLGYDVKFGSHLVRLYYEIIELLNTGRITFPFTGEQFDTIMAVKTGKLSLQELLDLCEELKQKGDEAYSTTTLPDNPDWDYVNRYLIDVTLSHFVRNAK